MPERKMGAAVGQDCALLEEVCGWINAKATVPVWAKMTPNITDIALVGFESCPLNLIILELYSTVFKKWKLVQLSNLWVMISLKFLIVCLWNNGSIAVLHHACVVLYIFLCTCTCHMLMTRLL